MRIIVKVGSRGQLIIPKAVRESIGLRENGPALLEVKEKKLYLYSFTEEDG